MRELYPNMCVHFDFMLPSFGKISTSKEVMNAKPGSRLLLSLTAVLILQISQRLIFFSDDHSLLFID